MPAQHWRPFSEQPLWPSLGAEMALLLFSEGLFQQLVLHGHLGVHLLQPPILIDHRFHLTHQRGIHPAKLRTPVVESGVADPMLAAEVCNGHTSFALLQDRKNLRATKSRFLQFILSAASKPEKASYQVTYFRG